MTETGGDGPFREDDPGTETFSCPKCGHRLPVGTPICGNCGTILQGGTHVPEPLAASGIRPGPVITVAVVAALGIMAFLGRETIKDAANWITDTVESGTAGGDPGDTTLPGRGDGGDRGGGDRGGGGGRGNGGDDEGEARPKGARTVGEVVRELRAAGIPCTPARVDASDDFVASGNCQSNGRHVQINVYFTPETIAFARDFYADFAFASVHRDNWWISGDTALMREIKAAIGGRFQPPS